MNIGIVGLGLIGGSMARAVKNAGYRVLGFDINREVLMRAMLLEIVDEELNSQNLASCDIIILGLYPQDTLNWLEENAGLISKSAFVMDTCGVKVKVCYKAWDIANKHGFFFIGAHPMEGTANIGFAHSSGSMFKGASMILCPQKELTLEAMKRLKDVLDSAGFGRYVYTSPENHDSMIALTSQLAHVVSSAFVKAPLAKLHKGYSAGSFKDMTRVAALNETMWTELFLDNKDNLLLEIDGLMNRLKSYRQAISKEDESVLKQLLKEGSDIKVDID